MGRRLPVWKAEKDVSLRLFVILLLLTTWKGPPHLSQDLASGFLPFGWFFLERRFPETLFGSLFGSGSSPRVLFLRLLLLPFPSLMTW